MKFHPIAGLFPLMEGAEFDELAADIKARGLIETIWLYDNLIIDGRNRYRACLEVGVEPRYRTWEGGGSLVLFVVSLNLIRRHLNESQLAFVALKVLPALEAEAKERQGVRTDLPEQIPEGETGDAREKAATAFKVNPHYVSDAKKLEAEEPALAAECRAGRETITGAKKIIKAREREQTRAANQKLVDGCPSMAISLGEQRFKTIVADPPWCPDDFEEIDLCGRASPNYSTMTLEELAKLPVGQFAEKNCHLWLWAHNRSIFAARDLMADWGFEQKTIITWCKRDLGLGSYLRNNTEHVLFGVRGSLPVLRNDCGTWFEAPRAGPHSTKPNEFYGLVETLSPGPWLDLFARTERPGWKTWGAEAS